MNRLLNVPFVCALSIVGVMAVTSANASARLSQSSSTFIPTQPNALGECATGSSETGQVSGHITARNNGALIQNVAALAYRLDGSPVTGAGTSMFTSSGVYTLTLPAGSYKIAADSVGSISDSGLYARAWFSNQDNFDDAVVVTVISDSVQSNVDIALPIGAQIKGRVSAADTQTGLENIAVTAEITVTQGSFHTVRKFTTYTDASGVYTLTGLVPGSYTLLFNPSVNSNLPYVGQYYSGKLSKATANPVIIPAVGDNITNINVALTTGAMIRGRVVAAISGLPFSDPIYRPFAVAIGDGIGANAKVDIGGNYTMTVPSGRYKVLFVADRLLATTYRYLNEYFDNQTTIDAAQAIDIVAPNTRDNINAALDQGALITGTVTDRITGLPTLGTTVVLRTAEGNYLNSVHPETDGTFNTAYGLRPGTYELFVDALNHANQRLIVTVPPTGDVAVNIALMPCSALSQITYLPLLHR